MQKISKKSKDHLWEVVFNEITDTRVEILKVISDKRLHDYIDTVFFRLALSTAEKVTNCFKYDKDI